MAQFAYNNAKYTSTSYNRFELNYKYYSQILFEDKTNPQFKSRSANKLIKELKKLIDIYCQNLIYAQELWKKTDNIEDKNRIYTLSKKF